MAEFEWTEAAMVRLRALWASGMSSGAIGAAMGISKNSVGNKARRLGLAARPSPIKRIADDYTPLKPTRRRVRRPVTTLAPLAVLAASPPGPGQTAPPPAPTPRAIAPEKLTGACCWPIGEPGTRGYRSCDAPCARSRTYCDEHHARSRMPTKPMREHRQAL